MIVSSIVNGDSFAVNPISVYCWLRSVRCRTLDRGFLFFSQAGVFQARYPAHEAQQPGDADQAGEQAAADEEDDVLGRHVGARLRYRSGACQADAGHQDSPEDDADPCKTIHVSVLSVEDALRTQRYSIFNCPAG